MSVNKELVWNTEREKKQWKSHHCKSNS